MEETMSTLNTSMASMQNSMAMKDKQQIAAMRAKKLSLKKRKACIKKKTMELSVLCGIEAGVLIVDDNGEVEMWPENQAAMMKIITRYKNIIHVHNAAGKSMNEYSYDQNLLQKDCSNVFDGDQYKKKNNNNMVLNWHSWDDHLVHGLQLESLQEVLRSVDAKLEAVASRIEFLKMVVDDDGKNNKGKEIVVFGEEAKPQNTIQTTSMSFPSSMCLSGGGNLNQQIIESPNFGWSGYGTSLISYNNVLGSSGVDLSVNNHQITPSFGGHFEQGFLNGKQTMQTHYFGQESDEFLLNKVPGMHPPPEFTTRGLHPEPAQSTFGIWQNRTGFLDHHANQFPIHQLQQSNHSFHQF